MNNKRLLSFISILLFATGILFAYECVTIRDTPFFIGPYGGFVMQKILKKGTVLHFDRIRTDSLDLISLEYDEDEKYLKKMDNMDIGDYLIVTTPNNEKGRVFINDVTVDKTFNLPSEVTSKNWIPSYMMTVLESKNPKMLENYDENIKNYHLWREYTDWQNDDWYADYAYPYFLISNSFIGIEGFNSFGGWIAGIITDITGNRIEWVCVESDEGTKYPIPKYLTKQFQVGNTYVFEYTLDGDYLDIYIDGNQFYSLIPFSRFLSEKLQKFFFSEGKNVDLKDVTFPRRADKNHTVGTSCIVAENLRLRKEESTTSATLQTMRTGTSVKILQLGKKQTIDGITANWVQVELADGVIGWCFGGYLVEK